MLSVSVIVATFNREFRLRRLVDALRVQDFPSKRFEVILVDDGSTDGTGGYLRTLHNDTRLQIRVLSQNNRGPASARNFGARVARGDLFAFIDDDCVPDSNWLSEMVICADRDASLAGIGGMIVRLHDNVMSRWVDRSGIMGHPLYCGGATSYLVTANAVFRRRAFEEVGGFNEQIGWPGGEDPELALRIRLAGGRLGICSGSRVRHEHRDSFRGLFRTFFCYGRGSIFFSTPSSWGVRSWRGRKAIIRLLCGCSWRHLTMAFYGAFRPSLSLAERITELTCGVIRAFGFCWGRAYQHYLF
ncbi:glycosyltransferase [Thiorhodovibrio frisius]|uniref:Putative glycosyltransferase n=1 Tax=Thiorhodovibrio frisius TaxID=631362 RepID=H8Z0B8_9GAMM|nr:putative glycosyltransferase [Thiorhodovibrio frisius]WPL24623.1 GalNAc(5)-diNAcBac-PP-undecaprenol beta-1,3-glucosyltransferase [Thiorhodovibrio frisius]